MQPLRGNDSPLAKLARVLVHYSTEVNKDESVLLSGSTASEPLIKALFAEVLRAGAHPRVRMSFEDQEYLFYRFAQDHQIDRTDPLERHEMETVDAYIVVVPDLNPHALTGVDAGKKQRRIKARRPVVETIMRRWSEGSFRWVGTAAPSPALAQEARMAQDEYAAFLFQCMHLDTEDPVTVWRELSTKQQTICDRLNQTKTMHYVGLDTDLTFRCEGRTWINCDGKNNFPDGEVFTSPVEDSLEGTIRFTYPGIFQGEEVEDIFLRFEKGRVAEARAAKGEALLHSLLETDEGARYAGEAAIGTNDQIDRFTKNMLLDEKMGGTVHIALGRGFPLAGGKNQSALHWDMLKDMRDGGQIWADGTLIYENGAFLPLT